MWINTSCLMWGWESDILGKHSLYHVSYVSSPYLLSFYFQHQGLKIFLATLNHTETKNVVCMCVCPNAWNVTFCQILLILMCTCYLEHSKYSVHIYQNNNGNNNKECKETACVEMNLPQEGTRSPICYISVASLAWNESVYVCIQWSDSFISVSGSRQKREKWARNSSFQIAA